MKATPVVTNNITASTTARTVKDRGMPSRLSPMYCTYAPSGASTYVDRNDEGMPVRMGQQATQANPADAQVWSTYASALREADLAVTASQARQTIRLIELAMQSSAEKRTIPYRE